MATTLTLEEESFVKELKAQGKNTQQIMVALASKRVGVVDSRDKTAELAPLKPTVQRVLSDMPSDFLETGRNIKQSITDSGQNLRETWQDTNANLIMKSAATLPQMGKSVLDVAGEAAIGYGKLATTDEFEKAVTKKIGETGQQIADTGFAKSLVQFRENLSPEAKFVLDKIIAPQAEVMFEGATMGGGAVAGKTAGKVFEKGATEAVGDFAELTKGVFKTVPDTPIVAPVPSEVKKTIVSAFDTAIKPNLISKQTPLKRAQYEKAVSEGLESIADNVENLKFVDETTGEVVTGRLPQNLKELVDGMEQTKQAIFKKYDDLAERAGEAGARIDTIKVANELDEIINSRSLKLSNPQATKYAEEVRERLLQTKALSAIDAQDVIRNYNNSLDAFYRNPTPEGLTRNAVDALVANRLRSILDDEIGAITGANYQGIKRQYASLKAIERDVMRAYNRDARRNAKGLIDFTDVLTGGQLVSGLLSMNPAAIGQGLGGKLIASGIKMLNDPNRKVKQIFEELGRYKRPADEMSMPTRKQLPSGKPNAPRSEVSSGRAIEAGGETPRGRVETGITERAKEGAVKTPSGERVPTFSEKLLKQMKETGVDTDDVKKAIAGGTVGTLLMLYIGDDGELLPAFGVILGTIASRKARLSAVEDAIKQNNLRRDALMAKVKSEKHPSVIKNNEVNKQLHKKKREIIDSMSPGLTTKDISKDPSFKQGATPNLTTDPDLRTNRAVPMKDVAGQKFTVPEGTVIKPKLNEKGNAVITVDGKSYTVPKNQYDNLKGQSTRAVASEFAPELKGTVETVRGVKTGDPKAKAMETITSKGYVVEEDMMDMYITKNGDVVEYDDLPTDVQRAVDTYFGDAETKMDVDPGLATKYSQYTLDGGENYREILVRAPDTKADLVIKQNTKGDWGHFVDGVQIGSPYPTEQAARIAASTDQRTINALGKERNKNVYRSSHWSEPNVISHIRMNERIVDGKKYAFMEELQSDWARDARSKDNIPNNPLLKDWQIPTTKRALIEAVDSGADRFAWINGEQTSARYNLATHVESVEWMPASKSFNSGVAIGEPVSKVVTIKPQSGGTIDIGFDKTGTIIKSDKGDFEGKKLDEVLGKGLADKIMEKETGTLSGDGLSFGGEWAKNLYDKQVRDIVKKLTGAEVKTVDMGLELGQKNIQTLSTLQKEVKRIKDEIAYDKKVLAKNYDYIDRGRRSKQDVKDHIKLLQEQLIEAEKAVSEYKPPAPELQQYIDLTPEVKAKIQSKAPKFNMKDGVNVAMPLLLAYFYVESE
jgi:hypothetical protein